VPRFLDNLADQFELAAKRGLKVSKVQIESGVFDLTRIFVNAVERQAEQRLLSPLQIALKKSAEARKKEMRRVVALLEGQGEHRVTQDKPGTETHRQIVKDPKLT
jgi:hypothetical protein